MIPFARLFTVLMTAGLAVSATAAEAHDTNACCHSSSSLKHCVQPRDGGKIAEDVYWGGNCTHDATKVSARVALCETAKVLTDQVANWRKKGCFCKHDGHGTIISPAACTGGRSWVESARACKCPAGKTWNATTKKCG